LTSLKENFSAISLNNRELKSNPGIETLNPISAFAHNPSVKLTDVKKAHDVIPFSRTLGNADF
jgi:hypothetical protein